jgi:hypothetical protein
VSYKKIKEKGMLKRISPPIDTPNKFLPSFLQKQGIFIRNGIEPFIRERRESFHRKDGEGWVNRSFIQSQGLITRQAWFPGETIACYSVKKLGPIPKSFEEGYSFSEGLKKGPCDMFGIDCKAVGYGSHIIHDSVPINLFEFTGLESLQQHSLLQRMMIEYVHRAVTYANCYYRINKERDMCCIVIGKAVSPGEELLIPYGIPYWLNHTYGNNPLLFEQMELVMAQESYIQRVKSLGYE